MNQPQYFKLFASCIPIKGSKESVILDLENASMFPIPNILLKVLQQNKNRTVIELKSYFKNNLNNGIDSYFNMFVENNLGFFTNEPASFPDIERVWKSPFKIINAVVEFSSNSTYSLESCIKQLDGLGCEGVQLRLVGKIDFDSFLVQVNALKYSRIKYVEIYLDYVNELDEEYLKSIRDLDARVSKIIIYSSPFNKQLDSIKSYYKDIFYYTEKSITDASKEIFSFNHFAVNITTYTESRLHNIGLNRKICIDQYGGIKNYLSHDRTYGNINDHKMEDIINRSDFKEKWFIHNDKVQKCCDCQFRYVCVSNSDITFKDGCYTKITQCNFDPYKNTWN